MKRLLSMYLLLLVFILAGCADISIAPSKAVKADTWYSVSSYVDGDTFKIKVGKNETTIRLLYIDTPETVKPDAPIEAYGPEASALTKQLLEESGKVRLTFDKETQDRFDRTLAVVELKDGRILNEVLLEEGLAKVMIYEPNVKMENVYKQLEQKAKEKKVALWNSGKETSQTDVVVHKKKEMGITIEVDKKAELVTITNTTSSPIDLEGWKLVSVRGNQTYTFEPHVLAAQGKTQISSGEDITLDHQIPLIIWEVDNVWNNQESDPAELYNENNELVAVWEDK
ncbi:thermonuclease family protein [Paenibacillus sp. GSMTC-2017]|uniref:thermonuclease family protein n=1 Tax=Paenibacillus sp. GSMTC-2017 TaxID=2794350 RepID=UPI0018D907BE|nr:thermonuclease family protein [Paenibacillus sp. GSMTC-2017]MBH5316780.1 thermonuclease family protein [Paenibacillus sp. GSMTC-2017]